MALKNKYQQVIDTANTNGVTDLKINEQATILYLSGTVHSEDAKDKILAAYEHIDPKKSSGDLVLDIKVSANGNQQTYTVKSGDSLSKIAGNYSGITWQEIFNANKDQISDADLIHPGQVLKIPVK